MATTPKKITELDADAAPTLDDLLAVVNDPAGTPVTKKATIAAVLAAGGFLSPAAWLVCGRLTTESGVPVSTADRTAQATIYWTPYHGDSVPLYTGSAWIRLAFSEISLALSGLTSGKNYDVFLYNNSGTLALELSAAWTNDTTRADAVSLQNGLFVKTSATTRLHVGTIRTTNTTTTEDSLAKRFVWNAYNQVPRALQSATETTDSWNYTTATWRQANANAANQLAYVTGSAATVIEATVQAMRQNSTANKTGAAGIGVDSTSANSALMYGEQIAAASTALNTTAVYKGMPGLGYHVLPWLEYSEAFGTATWFGDAGDAVRFQSALAGTMRN